MNVEFTAHNIRLDDGSYTKPDMGMPMDAYPWFLSAKRILNTVFPGNREGVRLADVGCLEGGYAVEFARMGFDVLGIEVRASNIAACNYVKARTHLPRLQFVQDDALNIAHYGIFDGVFCCGLLYHLQEPKRYLATLSSITRRLLILQTHFATASEDSPANRKFTLSAMAENEDLPGRWYTEFGDDEAFRKREEVKWSAWGNRRSFWVQREYLLQAIHDAGFDLVLEQYDSLAPRIADGLLNGYYMTDTRGTFIGIKTTTK